MADRMLSLALAISLAGLLIIAYVSPSMRPPMSSLGEVTPASLEKAVRIEGNVSAERLFKGGSMMLTLSDGASSLDVYLSPSAASALNGTKLLGRVVEASGTVQLFRGRLEVAVEDSSGIGVK